MGLTATMPSGIPSSSSWLSHHPFQNTATSECVYTENISSKEQMQVDFPDILPAVAGDNTRREQLTSCCNNPNICLFSRESPSHKVIRCSELDTAAKDAQVTSATFLVWRLILTILDQDRHALVL